ncbi:MAG: Txe/YoeB family addiction module toxin [Gammaproteobacteria bacterium]|uniref:Putative mRNA interferase YoeB n=1 Tax=hydrothermal vent metagenome TaxID=652676 RepID=A0A1W1E406_9ZZZZ|nr:Txe/YoeB family addiction module toxin [Gammaproteobacteria bacterium]
MGGTNIFCKHRQSKGQHYLCNLYFWIRVLKDVLRNDPRQGIGKPELLKHKFSGYWSRRISQKDRVVYKFDEDNIYIVIIGGHYDNLVNLKIH